MLKRCKKEDSFCGRIITVLKDQQPEKEYKIYHNRFVLINKLLYCKPDSKHYILRIVLTEVMLKQALKEQHDSPTAGHYGSERTYLNIAEKC